MASALSSVRVGVRQLVAFVAAAIVLGIAAATWLHVIGGLEGRPASFVDTVAFVMPFWLLWALYAPFVVWMTTHHPIERGRVVTRAGTHVAVAVAMAFLHTGLRFGLQPRIREALPSNAADPSAWHRLLSLYTLELPVHIFIYAAILGTTYIMLDYRRSKAREVAAIRLTAQLADARMEALRMQLNPHFLFNALNSVAMLVRDSQRDAAVEALEGVSDLLRHVLAASASHEVTLQQEIAFIERYLAVERIRFHDRLALRIDMPDDTMDALVPNFVLQPIVENAIRHGVAGQAGVTAIMMVARTEGDRLRLEVLDDGPGFGGTPADPRGTGLGIVNTRKRLAQLYGHEASLDVQDRSPHGAAVTIVLPLHFVPLAEREP
ncbi:MAG: histidine kinase [Gemmatimonadota bacterium]|nr:histidine kinase [Gemmatimonadota bacterium]